MAGPYPLLGFAWPGSRVDFRRRDDAFVTFFDAGSIYSPPFLSLDVSRRTVKPAPANKPTHYTDLKPGRPNGPILDQQSAIYPSMDRGTNRIRRIETD
jgi:hypothetical protein